LQLLQPTLTLGLVALWSGPVQAGFPGIHVAESVVVGAGLAIALGEVEEHRYGWGLDVGWQRQFYTQEGVYVDEAYYVWPDNHLAPNLGGAAHLWRVDGAWQVSLCARAGLAKPLRVGLLGGWWPGASVAAELGYLVSTDGAAGVDLQGAVEGPWVQARLGQVLTLQGWQARRLHLGVFSPLQQPELWDNANVGWHPPE
jgi:hypothetical protein